jgi:hypothetical protein
MSPCLSGFFAKTLYHLSINFMRKFHKFNEGDFIVLYSSFIFVLFTITIIYLLK